MLMALSSGAYAADEAVDKFTHEGWAGQAIFRDGKFFQCSMAASAINNWDLGFGITPSGELRMGLSNKDLDLGWAMVFDQKSAVRIQLDQGPVFTKAFTAKSPKLLTTSLQGTDWESKLPDGKLLRVNTGSKVRLFHLNGIREA